MLDVFKADAFSVMNLTDALNNLKFVPGRVGELGIFLESGVTTTTVAIEQKNNVLSLVTPSPRGGPGITLDKAKRNLRNLSVPHFEINDAVMAEEVQGIRAFGQEDAVETVMGKVAERQATHVDSFAATTEHARIGAIKGVVSYGDGTSLNLFSEFGVSQITERAWDLAAAAPAAGVVRKTCAAVIRQIGTELDGIPWSGQVHALCGDDFFDDLLAHTEVRDTYKNWTAAEELRRASIGTSGKSYGAFSFGGIMWENYRGALGGNSLVHTDKCHIFPLGVPNLFRTYHAPADYVETVNTMGRRLYGKQFEMPNGKGIHLDTQMNELNICTRPRVLLQGKRGS